MQSVHDWLSQGHEQMFFFFFFNEKLVELQLVEVNILQSQDVCHFF